MADVLVSVPQEFRFLSSTEGFLNANPRDNSKLQ
jgi:hypothetical protein